MNTQTTGPNKTSILAPLRPKKRLAWGEIWLVVIFPLLVPALALSMARQHVFAGDATAFRIDEMSFAFTTVAIASLVRAVSNEKVQDRLGWICLLTLAIVAFSGTGLVTNITNGADRILVSVEEHFTTVDSPPSEERSKKHSPNRDLEFMLTMDRLESERLKVEPGRWLWALVLTSGGVLCLSSGVGIWKT